MQILFCCIFCQFAPEFSSVKPVTILGLGLVCPGAGTALNPVEMLGTSAEAQTMLFHQSLHV